MVNPNFNTILAKALEKQKRITNADRIRAMSDEQLAIVLTTVNHGNISFKEYLEWLKRSEDGDVNGIV